MLDVDPIKLINAIKARPPLYNKCDKSYHGQIHRKPKEKLWRDVGEEVHPSWSQLNLAQKCDFVREVQKRWKSLRTCFTRELAVQTKERIKRESNEPVKRRKRYEYFEYLLFLKEASDEEVTKGEESDGDDSIDPLNNQTDAMDYEYGEPSNIADDNVKMEVTGTQYQPQIMHDRSTAKDKSIDILTGIKYDEDEDRQFMLSMVPTFKNLEQKQKLAARIEMLKIIQKFTSPPPAIPNKVVNSLH